MSSIAQPWLISKFVDPVFAICVGTAAAAIRIRREEVAKYPDQENDFRYLWKKGHRMGMRYFAAYGETKQ